MGTNLILQRIDAEIQLLQQAKSLLSGDGIHRRPSQPAAYPSNSKKRRFSAAARARMAAAQKERWAKARKSAE